MIRLVLIAAVLGLTAGPALAGSAAAQPHPKNGHVAATAVCRDGTLTDSTTKNACKHHGGVERWIKHPHH